MPVGVVLNSYPPGGRRLDELVAFFDVVVRWDRKAPKVGGGDDRRRVFNDEAVSGSEPRIILVMEKLKPSASRTVASTQHEPRESSRESI